MMYSHLFPLLPDDDAGHYILSLLDIDTLFIVQYANSVWYRSIWHSLRTLQFDDINTCVQDTLVYTTLKRCSHNLQHLHFNNCSLMTEKALYFHSFRRLKSLTFQGCLALDLTSTLSKIIEHEWIPELEDLVFNLIWSGLDEEAANSIAYFSNLRRFKCTGNSSVLLGSLSQLPNLECLEMPSCYYHADHFKQLPLLLNLTKLNLSNCYGLSSDGLREIIKLDQLTYLNINSCHSIENEDFALISSLQELTYLDCSYCDIVGDEALSTIGSLINLKFLSMKNTNLFFLVGYEGFNLLQDLKMLTTFSYVNHRPGTVDLGGISQLSSLTSLTFGVYEIKPDSFCALKDLSLKNLVINNTVPVLGQILTDAISNVDNLECCKFHFENNYPGDNLTHLPSSLNNLKELTIENIRFNSLSFLENITNLRKLKLQKIGDINFDFGALNKLVELDLSNTNTRIENIQNISSPLKILNLRNTLIRGSDIIHLSHLENLEVLDLSHCISITSESIEPLSNLKFLKKLLLHHCDIDDRSIPLFQGFMYLKELDLTTTLVTSRSQVLKSGNKTVLLRSSRAPESQERAPQNPPDSKMHIFVPIIIGLLCIIVAYLLK
eukprot:TRINITY_DN8405_c0_g1_i1.p1 TRINITY_DN8405_c0_g1~~TRINITY_DN8405_c0_g1_i1.p1  ORF type:complete len:607 (+),score=83.92 TRINITY_DN8405_c0_g1_i1:114-1934(+)